MYLSGWAVIFQLTLFSVFLFLKKNVIELYIEDGRQISSFYAAMLMVPTVFCVSIESIVCLCRVAGTFPLTSMECSSSFQ